MIAIVIAMAVFGSIAGLGVNRGTIEKKSVVVTRPYSICEDYTHNNGSTKYVSEVKYCVKR